VSYVEITPAEVCCGYTLLQEPRAHAPPVLLSLIPRPPPAGLIAAV
jgi:hypothetical protein